MQGTGNDVRRIPSLDGLRAISIAMVLCGHASATPGFPGGADAIWGDLSKLGVSLFFVISGYLITGLLHEELRQTGALDLKRFYLRRALRIMPAYYVYLLVIASAMAVGQLPVAWGDWWLAAIYLTNVASHIDEGRRAWSVGHTWSLALEEQFYWLWPVLLGGMSHLSPRRLLGATYLLAPLLGSLVLPATWPFSLAFVPSLAYLAIGCHLALAPRQWARVAKQIPVGLLLAIGVVSIAWPALCPPLLWGYGMPIVTGLLVARLTMLPPGVLARWLDRPLPRFIGGLSYSLYLWQQVFLDPTREASWTSFPLNLTLAFVAAWLSQRFVEKPLLHLKDRLFPRPAEGPHA